MGVRSTLLREALCAALEADPTLRVVGEAGSEDSIRELLEEMKPEVVVLDQDGFGNDADRMLSRWRRRFPSSRILVLTMKPTSRSVEQFLRTGASGVLGGDSGLRTLAKAIHSVAAGEGWAERRATAQALEKLADASDPQTRGAPLTRREKEIAEWVSHGLRNKEIARKLEIHEKTVKTHMNSIFRKLQIGSRIALAVRSQGKVLPKS